MKRLRNRMTGTINLIEPIKEIEENLIDGFKLIKLFDENNKINSISYETL